MEVFNSTMGMEPDPALLKGLLRDSIGHILAVQPAAIDTLRRRPDIHRFLPSQAGIFHDLPRPAHDERASSSSILSSIRICARVRYDTSELGLINCENTTHVDTIWTIYPRATTTIKRNDKRKVSLSEYALVL